MGCTVAAVQLNAGPRVADNLEVVRCRVAEAADAGAVLVALPENFSIMAADRAGMLAAAENFGGGPAQDCLAECAARHRVWLVGGSVPLASDNPQRVRSACLVYDPDGGLARRYDKLHLFDVDLGDGERYHESDYIEPGAAPAVVDTAAGRLGLSICYDLRFPELYRALLDMGACSVVAPAAFSATTGRVHWEMLLRARATENQVYVIAPAQYGRHANDRETYGHTMIVDPWGEVLASRADGDGIVTAVLDENKQAQLRRSFPVLHHRRPLSANGASGADGAVAGTVTAIATMKRETA